MATLSELLKELETLPIGNVYDKKIKGNIYSYYQYFENGQRFTKKIDEETKNELLPKIKRRKELEQEIKAIKENQGNFVLSKNAASLTGYVMAGNHVVATFEKGRLIDWDDDLVPLVIKRTRSIEPFLKLRVIDISRTNARILKKALGIQTSDENVLPLYSYALSIYDNYWFKPKHSKLKYKDIAFNDDSLFDLSLKGNSLYFSNKPRLTPELTTGGSFEKGWKIINDEWWLYKTGNNNQIFSELFCYHLASLLDIDTAIYEYDDGYIRSKNFADKYNFEPMAALTGENEEYDHVFNILYEIDKDIAKQYIRLIFFDSVVYNIDRHSENMGVMRDRKTGKIISLAPNFDNNLAVLGTRDTVPSPVKDQFIKLFVSFLNNNEKACEMYKKMKIRVINEEDVNRIVDLIPIDVPNKEDIALKVYQRYKYLIDII